MSAEPVGVEKPKRLSVTGNKLILNNTSDTRNARGPWQRVSVSAKCAVCARGFSDSETIYRKYWCYVKRLCTLCESCACSQSFGRSGHTFPTPCECCGRPVCFKAPGYLRRPGVGCSAAFCAEAGTGTNLRKARACDCSHANNVSAPTVRLATMRSFVPRRVGRRHIGGGDASCWKCDRGRHLQFAAS